MFVSRWAAAQIYRCAAACGEDIAVGDETVREALPPWTLVQDDPDTDPAPIGEWWTLRYHARCWEGRH